MGDATSVDWEKMPGVPAQIKDMNLKGKTEVPVIDTGSIGIIRDYELYKPVPEKPGERQVVALGTDNKTVLGVFRDRKNADVAMHSYEDTKRRTENVEAGREREREEATQKEAESEKMTERERALAETGELVGKAAAIAVNTPEGREQWKKDREILAAAGEGVVGRLKRAMGANDEMVDERRARAKSHQTMYAAGYQLDGQVEKEWNRRNPIKNEVNRLVEWHRFTDRVRSAEVGFTFLNTGDPPDIRFATGGNQIDNLRDQRDREVYNEGFVKGWKLGSREGNNPERD